MQKRRRAQTPHTSGGVSFRDAFLRPDVPLQLGVERSHGTSCTRRMNWRSRRTLAYLAVYLIPSPWDPYARLDAIKDDDPSEGNKCDCNANPGPDCSCEQEEPNEIGDTGSSRNALSPDCDLIDGCGQVTLFALRGVRNNANGILAICWSSYRILAAVRLFDEASLSTTGSEEMSKDNPEW